MRTAGRPTRRSLTDSQGAFSFPAQFERYAIVAIHDDRLCRGEPRTRPAARRADAEGLGAGRGPADAGGPARPFGLDPLQPAPASLRPASPHIQDGISVKTDRPAASSSRGSRR